jgi:hypothetical protein
MPAHDLKSAVDLDVRTFGGAIWTIPHGFTQIGTLRNLIRPAIPPFAPIAHFPLCTSPYPPSYPPSYPLPYPLPLRFPLLLLLLPRLLPCASSREKSDSAQQDGKSQRPIYCMPKCVDKGCPSGVIRTHFITVSLRISRPIFCRGFATLAPTLKKLCTE